MNPTAENDSSSSSPPAPPPFDPIQPSIPISYPIKTLEDLESRAYFNSFHYPFNIAKVKLKSSNSHAAEPLPDRQRMLVCHDMAGGYTDDDKWIQGGKNPEAYAIWHWYLMDIFVYFSHNLVTLPPPCWTNTAHKHGVKVLGTFIMEWDEGTILAKKLLSTVESAQMYAERLAELALALEFDGWLINMEVKIDKENVTILKEFVSHLTKTMHSFLPGSLIIWYDSVTDQGELNWQNQLNANNKPFFDLCDGIFVNYTWKENYPKLSGEVAGNRKFDVYMGIDVFGRGTYGGGQWTTNVALDVIRQNDVSAAIFAPGWVYENFDKQEFQALQNRWWGLIEKSWGIVQKYPQILPFYSNFDQGRGYHFSINGELYDYPWNNISSQTLQPFLEYSEDSNPDTIVQSYVDLKGPSYSGGGNITFKGNLKNDAIFTARLFEGELVIKNSLLYLSYSAKSTSIGNSLLGLVLYFSDEAKEEKTVFLASQGNNSTSEHLLIMNRFSSKFTKVIMPHKVFKGGDSPWSVIEFKIAMKGHVLTKISGICYKLIIIKELHQTPESSNIQVTLTDSSKYDKMLNRDLKFHTLLGHINISTSSSQENNFPPSDLWTVTGEYVKWTINSEEGVKYLNIKLIWEPKNGKTDLFLRYLIHVKELLSLDGGESYSSKFLGVAETEAFYVSDLVVSSGTFGLKFIIQVCNLDGEYQKEQESPFLVLEVEGS